MSIVTWKSHSELFTDLNNLNYVMKKLATKNKYKINKNINYIKPVRPLLHDERQKDFRDKMAKSKNLIISFDMETGTEGEMLPYMIVFSLKYYSVDEDTQFVIK
jgi:hypothetical protein